MNAIPIPSYFHMVPNDLLEIIISMLNSAQTLKYLRETYYIFYKVSENLELWKRLLSKKLGDASSIIKDVVEIRNISFTLEDYMNLYYSKLELDNNNEKYIDKIFKNSPQTEDIVDRLWFNKKYPNLYQQLKQFDLSKKGSMNLIIRYYDIEDDSGELLKDTSEYSDSLRLYVESGNIPPRYI